MSLTDSFDNSSSDIDMQEPSNSLITCKVLTVMQFMFKVIQVNIYYLNGIGLEFRCYNLT